MSKFILISVCDREIMTEIFDSYEEARAQRNKEMKEMIEWARVPEDVFRDGEEEYEDDVFAYGKYEAHANDRRDLDWLIVEIPMEEKK